MYSTEECEELKRPEKFVILSISQWHFSSLNFNAQLAEMLRLHLIQMSFIFPGSQKEFFGECS